MIEELEKFLQSQSKKLTDYLFGEVERMVRQKSNFEIYEAVGMIPEKKVIETFGIKDTLLREWRNEYGLKRYKPYETSKKAYYDIEELKEFVKRVED